MCAAQSERIPRYRPFSSLTILSMLKRPRGWRVRVLALGDDTVGARAGQMFRLCTGRFPNSQELADLISGFEQDMNTFRKDPAAAAAFVGAGSFRHLRQTLTSASGRPGR